LIDNFNVDINEQGNHILFENYLNISLIFKAFIYYCYFYLKSIFLYRKSELFRPRNSDVDFYPLLKEDWISSLRGGTAMKNCLFIQAIDNILKNIPRQSLGVYSQENMYWECALLHGWRRYNHGRIIGAPLETVNFWDIRYAADKRTIQESSEYLKLPTPDIVAFNGPVAKDYFLAASYLENTLREVEALRYLYMEKNLFIISDPKDSSLDNNLNILIVGELNGDATKQMLDAVLKATIDNSSITVSIKPHPACPFTFDEYSISIFYDDPIEEILPNYDLIVVAKSTSAAVDVYHSGKMMVVFLGNEELNLSPFRNFDDVIFVCSSKELKIIIDSMGSTNNKSLRKEFFYTDSLLPRWKSLINSQINI